MLSAANSLFVKPFRGLRAVLARSAKAGEALPCADFRNFLAAWNAFQTAMDAAAGQSPEAAALLVARQALRCVDALEALDPTPCHVLRTRLASWLCGIPEDCRVSSSKRSLDCTCLPGEPDFDAAHCSTPRDVAVFCHARAVKRMLDLAAAGQKKAGVRQLWDEVPKQFWAVDLADAFAPESGRGIIAVEHIVSRPMRAIWYGMNILPWQGPPAVNGRGFLSVLFEATANPQLDPAFGKALFFEKNHFLLSSDYCHMHSRFGFHTVEVEARLGPQAKENHLFFRLRGGAANLERRMLRTRFIAEMLAPFGFTAQLRHDVVCARKGGINAEEGERLAAVMGYVTIHTRQLDMIMQDAAQVTARREVILAHCRALYAGRPL
ncbi:MAG: hypothetical protein IJD16_07010 [Desulfovibrio sp.]|nr:hypothetical protein [Desulfovibrio sp.]